MTCYKPTSGCWNEARSCVECPYSNPTRSGEIVIKQEYPKYVSGDYVIYPCNNQFNNKVSYWISKKYHTIAYYCFSVCSADDARRAINNNDVVQSYINMYDNKWW